MQLSMILPKLLMMVAAFLPKILGANGCAFVHLQKNYLMGDQDLEGVLYTNTCGYIYPQVNMVLADGNNRIIAESWLRLESSCQPFLLKIPAGSPEGMYRLLAITLESPEILFSQDIPIFDPSPALDFQDGMELSDGVINTVQRGLEVNWSPGTIRPGGIMDLEIKADVPDNELLCLSVKVSDRAQSLPDKVPINIDQRLSSEAREVLLNSHTFTLEGTLENSSGQGCNYCPVILTIPSLEQGIYYTLTGEAGSFSISGLSHHGTRVAYLSYPNILGEKPHQFRIREREPLVINQSIAPAADFESVKQRLLPQIMRNHLTAALRNHTQKAAPISETTVRPYQNILLYPRYDYQVKFDEYHLDSDMRRVIKSIIPYVNTIRKTQIRVFSVENSRNFPEAPLMLLDGIPVTSNAMLSVDPRTIFKVEVINKRRSLSQIGNIAQNGVLSFFTKNGIDDASFPGVQKILVKGFDNVDLPGSKPGNREFSRLVFWQPKTEIASGQPRVIRIPLPDYYVELLVSIVGSTGQGELVYYQSEISGF